MPEDRSGKKVFSYDEAVDLLPEVRRLTDAAYRQGADLGASTAGGGGGGGGQGRDRGVIGGRGEKLVGRGIRGKGPWGGDFHKDSGGFITAPATTTSPTGSRRNHP